MELKSFRAGTPVEEFEKALIELVPETRIRYRGYLKIFCEAMNTDPQELHDLALKWSRSEKTAERLSMKKAWVSFYDSLLEKGTHKNTAANYRKALNKFLQANGLPKIEGGTKSVQYRGQDTIRPEEVRRVLALPMSERIRALVLTLDQSGIRCSDVAQMTVEDFRGARRKIVNDREFRTWREPISSQKTGVNVPVCLGPESIEAIKNYIKGRETGAIFLRVKGMFHWTTDENGNRVKTEERTEIGSPMDRKNMTMAIWSLVKPLRAEGIKVSAQSFRKRFLNDWERARKLHTGKYIAGKKIPHNDAAYMELQSRYFEEYVEHYFEYITLEQRKPEIDNLNKRIKELERDAALRIEEKARLKARADSVDDFHEVTKDMALEDVDKVTDFMRKLIEKRHITDQEDIENQEQEEQERLTIRMKKGKLES